MSASPGDSVRFADPCPGHRDGLIALTSDKDTMSMVGNGQPWAPAKVDRFLDYAQADEGAEESGAEKPSARYMYSVIEERTSATDSASESHRPNVIGVVGIHPVTYATRPPRPAEKYFLTIFIKSGARRLGTGTAAIQYICRVFRGLSDEPIYLDIRADNGPMLGLAKKLDLMVVRHIQIGRKKYIRHRVRDSVDR